MAKIKKVHCFKVLKEFTLDKPYYPSDDFESADSKVINFLLTNKFIK